MKRILLVDAKMIAVIAWFTAAIFAVLCITSSVALAPQRNILPLPFIRTITPLAAAVPQADDEFVRRWNELAIAAAEWVAQMNVGISDARLWKRTQERARKAGLCEEKR